MHIRKAGSAFDVLVLNYFEPKYVVEALSYGIACGISSRVSRVYVRESGVSV